MGVSRGGTPPPWCRVVKRSPAPPPRMVTCELSRVCCWLRRRQQQISPCRPQEEEKSLSRAETGPRPPPPRAPPAQPLYPCCTQIVRKCSSHGQHLHPPPPLSQPVVPDKAHQQGPSATATGQRAGALHRTQPVVGGPRAGPQTASARRAPPLLTTHRHTQDLSLCDGAYPINGRYTLCGMQKGRVRDAPPGTSLLLCASAALPQHDNRV